MVDILLADDQPHVRSALRLLLEQESGARIVGQVENAADLLAKCRALGPDVILLDWELPGMGTLDGLAPVRQACPSAHIVALSSCPQVGPQALQAGADAFVCKGDPPEQLWNALHDWFGH